MDKGTQVITGKETFWDPESV